MVTEAQHRPARIRTRVFREEDVARIKADAVQAERRRIAREIEARYLGPDSGRLYDGRDAPDAALRNAYDDGLMEAARIARSEGR